MITYFFNESGIVDTIVFKEESLTEEERALENKIQLEAEYIVPRKKGYDYELYVEDGVLKHRYLEIEITENEKIKELEARNKELKELLKKQEGEITANQEAIVQVFEIISAGDKINESDS